MIDCCLETLLVGKKLLKSDFEIKGRKVVFWLFVDIVLSTNIYSVRPKNVFTYHVAKLLAGVVIIINLVKMRCHYNCWLALTAYHFSLRLTTTHNLINGIISCLLIDLFLGATAAHA